MFEEDWRSEDLATCGEEIIDHLRSSISCLLIKLQVKADPESGLRIPQVTEGKDWLKRFQASTRFITARWANTPTEHRLSKFSSLTKALSDPFGLEVESFTWRLGTVLAFGFLSDAHSDYPTTFISSLRAQDLNVPHDFVAHVSSELQEVAVILIEDKIKDDTIARRQWEAYLGLLDSGEAGTFGRRVAEGLFGPTPVRRIGLVDRPGVDEKRKKDLRVKAARRSRERREGMEVEA